MTYLNLSYTENITARSLQPVILHCSNLRILRLVHCSWLTSGAIEALALHQSCLEEVDFSYCNSVSESSLLIFVKKFRHLKILSLQGIGNVTDKCLLTISRFSFQLEYLNTADCPKVTPIGTQAVKISMNTRKEQTRLNRDCCQLVLKDSARVKLPI